jgi:hypothetical protein
MDRVPGTKLHSGIREWLHFFWRVFAAGEKVSIFVLFCCFCLLCSGSGERRHQNTDRVPGTKSSQWTIKTMFHLVIHALGEKY